MTRQCDISDCEEPAEWTVQQLEHDNVRRRVCGDHVVEVLRPGETHMVYPVETADAP